MKPEHKVQYTIYKKGLPDPLGNVSYPPLQLQPYVSFFELLLSQLARGKRLSKAEKLLVVIDPTRARKVPIKRLLEVLASESGVRPTRRAYQKLTISEITKIKLLSKNGFTLGQIAKQLGRSRATIQNILKQGKD